MRAYVLHAVGDLRYEECTYPECPPGWAVVQVKAAGICSSDIPRIFVRGTYHFPTIPGHELSGIVDRVGDMKDSNLVGKHVSIFPLIPCRKCSQCANGHYETCKNYDYIGSRRNGGFSEYVAVPVWNLVEAPDTVSFSALALSEPLAVALHAVKIAGSLSGATVAIIGTGMIGLSAAYWAKKRGARKIWVIGRSKGKRRLVESMTDIKYYGGNPGMRADIVIEAVGALQAISTAIEVAAPGGRVVLMGNPAEDITLQQDVYWQILRKQLSLYGTWNSQYDGNEPSDWLEVVRTLAGGNIPLDSFITHYLFQDELPEALALMRDHRKPYCKVMMLWNGCKKG